MSGTIKPASSHCLSNADFITEISQVSKRHQGIPFTITRNPTRGGSTSPVVKWHKHTFSQGWWTRGRDGWYSSYRAMVWLPEAFPLPWNLPILLYEPPFEGTQADSKMHWAQMECDPREEGAISVAWGGPSSREREVLTVAEARGTMPEAPDWNPETTALWIKQWPYESQMKGIYNMGATVPPTEEFKRRCKEER